MKIIAKNTKTARYKNPYCLLSLSILLAFAHPGAHTEAATDITLVTAGDTLSYMKGTTQPPDAWKGLGYDDSDWSSGPSGIGYGDGDDATELTDMYGNYVTVYTRKTFNIESAADVLSLVFSLDYDDGFVAYINGTEIARVYMPAGTIGKDTIANYWHEAGTPETFVIPLPKAVLVDGENVLAVEVHNDGVWSSDLSCIPSLTATIEDVIEEPLPEPPPPAAEAGTFYISPTGDDSNPGTFDAPWATFEHAFKNGMLGGDTLILKDGVYNQPMGQSFSNQPYNSYSPPSGSAGAYTVIRAENDGGAIIEDASMYIGGAIHNGIADGSSYLQIEGLKFRRGSIEINHSDHIKLFRIGIKNGKPITSRYGQVVKITGGSHHVLLEDVWVVGSMRYGVIVYESSKVILRRVVVRFDGNIEREPKSGICFYGATGNITGAFDSMAQNCIVIDYNPGISLGAGMMNVHGAQNIKYYGSIALNLPSLGFFTNEELPAGGNSIIDSIVWNTTKAGIAMRDGDWTQNTLLDHLTIGNTQQAIAQWSGYADENTYTAITNSIFLGNLGKNSGGDLNDYNIYDPSWQAQGSNAVTGDPGLLYLVQSPDTGTGAGGTLRGANIMKRYGVSGTLWDEPGYDELTTEDLWPWPSEDRIHADFAEADGFDYPTTDWKGDPYNVVNNTERGFAAPGQTLTRYIWEYLGNPIPDEIYAGGSPDEDPLPDNPSNEKPAADSQTVFVNEDGSVSIILTATDPDGDSLSYSTIVTPSNGVLSGTAPNLVYTPVADFNGSDSFAFVANDGMDDSDPAIVSITVTAVNDAPVLDAPSDITTQELDTLVLDISATDADSDAVTITLSGLTSFMNFDGNSLTLTPGIDASGVYTIECTASDGTLNDTDSFNLTVTNLNQAPTAQAASVTTDEDVSVNITLTATDPDGDSLTYSVVTAPSNGSLSGTAPVLVYTPAADFNGSDSFTFVANDGTVDSDPVTVSVTVAAVPDGHRVTSFTLINADTNKPVAGFESLSDGVVLDLDALPTRNLNIRANTSPRTVGNVRFGFDANSNYRTENKYPYALFGDSNGDYKAWQIVSGKHTVTATPYESGLGGAKLTISFTLKEKDPAENLMVTDFTLINADTNQPIAGFESLTDGAILDLGTLPTRRLSIRANTSPSTVGSVRFGLDANNRYRTENKAPYALTGDSNGNYRAWTPSLGKHIVTATPYTKSRAGGKMGYSASITFSVIDSN